MGKKISLLIISFTLVLAMGSVFAFAQETLGDRIKEKIKEKATKEMLQNFVPQSSENPICGNDICETEETIKNCSNDCGINPPPYHPEKYQSMIYYDRLSKKNIARTYLIHVPACYKKDTPIPVVLNFHGGAGTGEAVELQLDMNKKADKECFIAVYPNGISATGIPGRQQHWNSGSERTDIRNPEIDDVGFVSALLDKLEKEYNIDKNRIYATGASNGAQMSYRLACELSDKIAAVAPVVAGMLVKECKPNRPVAIMDFHGTRDPGWPYYGGHGCFTGDTFEPISTTISKWVKINQCLAAPRVTYQKGDTTCETYGCKENTEVTLCTIEGGGHTWPGGYAFPTEQAIRWNSECALGQGRGVGKITKDISAMDEMWEFFKKHPKE